MRYYSFVFLFFLFGTELCAQTPGQVVIDSLLTELQSVQNDSTKASILKDLAIEYRTISQYDEAIDYSQQTIALAKQHGLKREEAFAHNSLGDIYTNRGEYRAALKHLEEALTIRTHLKDTIGIGVVYNNQGLLLRSMGNYTEALQKYAEALKLFEQTNEKHRIAVVYDNMGMIYKRQGDLEKTMRYARDAAKINKELGNFSSLIVNYINIGTSYFDLGEFDKSLEFYLKALDLVEQTGYRIQESLLLGNIGSVYERKGNFEESLKYNLKGLSAAQRVNSKREVASAYNKIGVLYYNNDQAKKALPYYHKSLAYSEEMQSGEDMKETYEYLANCYYVLGDYKNAIEYYDLFVNLKDSLYSEENTRNLTQAVMNFEFEKTQDSIRLANELEIALRDASIADIQKQRWFLVGGVLGLMLIGGLLYYQNMQRRKHNTALSQLNAELDQANKTKLQFFNILNHDLRRPVANLIHFLHLKNDHQTDLLDENSKIRLEKQTMEGAENLLDNMEDLLLWSKGQMENFSPQKIDVQVQELFETIRVNFADEAQNIRFKFENSEKIQLYTDKHYLETILRNLTSNAVQALKSTDNARIAWEALTLDGHVLLAVTDNGPGADKEKFRALYDEKEVVGIKFGLGMHLIRDLAKAIGCVIEVRSNLDDGMTIVLRF